MNLFFLVEIRVYFALISQAVSRGRGECLVKEMVGHTVCREVGSSGGGCDSCREPSVDPSSRLSSVACFVDL